MDAAHAAHAADPAPHDAHKAAALAAERAAMNAEAVAAVWGGTTEGVTEAATEASDDSDSDDACAVLVAGGAAADPTETIKHFHALYADEAKAKMLYNIRPSLARDTIVLRDAVVAHAQRTLAPTYAHAAYSGDYPAHVMAELCAAMAKDAALLPEAAGAVGYTQRQSRFTHPRADLHPPIDMRALELPGDVAALMVYKALHYKNAMATAKGKITKERKRIDGTSDAVRRARLAALQGARASLVVPPPVVAVDEYAHGGF